MDRDKTGGLTVKSFMSPIMPDDESCTELGLDNAKILTFVEAEWRDNNNRKPHEFSDYVVEQLSGETDMKTCVFIITTCRAMWLGRILDAKEEAKRQALLYDAMFKQTKIVDFKTVSEKYDEIAKSKSPQVVEKKFEFRSLIRNAFWTHENVTQGG